MERVTDKIYLYDPMLVPFLLLNSARSTKAPVSFTDRKGEKTNERQNFWSSTESRT